MDMLTLLQKKISYQSKAWGELEKDITIQEALDDIKNGTLALQIKMLRAVLGENRTEDYNILKKKLPGVTFCASFNGARRKENLKLYNDIIVIDMDKLDPKELQRVKEILTSDRHVFSFWESPSKMGLKGLIALSFNFEFNVTEINSVHLQAFKKIQEEYFQRYGISIDVSGSDTTRLCFLSHDPNLVLKTSLVPFPVENVLTNEDPGSGTITLAERKYSILTGSTKHLLFNPTGKNNPADRRRIEVIIKYLKKINLSITNDYVNWVRVAYAIANSFTYDIGEKYFIRLSQLDVGKFDENECKNLLTYCYQTSMGTIKFRTITYLAKMQGFKIKEEKGEFLSGGQ
jgi:hypothetical protein